MASSTGTHDTATTPKPNEPAPGVGGNTADVTPDYAVAQFPARGIFVGFIIFTLVAATVAMSALIWYRWSGVREPTTAVIVKGDASLDGTVITVNGANRVVSATLDAANNYSVPILVDPGVYTVRAEHGGRVLLNKDVEVRRFFGIMFDLADIVRQFPPDAFPAVDPAPASAPSSPSARAATETQ